MFFCEKCRYSLNITKDVKNKQYGGKTNIALNNIFTKINDRQQLLPEDLTDVHGLDITQDERYTDVIKKVQKKITSRIKNIDKNFFVSTPKSSSTTSSTTSGGAKKEKRKNTKNDVTTDDADNTNDTNNTNNANNTNKTDTVESETIENDTQQNENDAGAYFVCKYCRNIKPINPGTLIYSKNYGTISQPETENYSYILNDDSLSKTANYICKNKDCATHQDPKLRVAVLTKNINDQLVYICKVCTTHWINSI